MTTISELKELKKETIINACLEHNLPNGTYYLAQSRLGTLWIFDEKPVFLFERGYWYNDGEQYLVSGGENNATDWNENFVAFELNVVANIT